jgi:hypothetical protein
MPDSFSLLLRERETIRDNLATWWQRWEAVYREQVGDGDPTAAVYSIDAWARETPEETAARIANRGTSRSEASCLGLAPCPVPGAG